MSEPALSPSTTPNESGRSRRNDGRDHDLTGDPPTTHEAVAEAQPVDPDRRKPIHHDQQPSADGGGEAGPDPGVAPADRRKVIHQSPSADGDTHPVGTESAPPDRRKTVHRDPTAETSDPPNPHDPPSRRHDHDESHGSVCCELTAESDPPDQLDGDNRPVGGEFAPQTVAEDDPEDGSTQGVGTAPAARARRAATLGGIQALPEEATRAVRMEGDPEDDTSRGVGTDADDPDTGRGVGTRINADGRGQDGRQHEIAGDPPTSGRLLDGARSLAGTLMLLAMLGTALGPALPQHHADEGHGHEVEHVGDVQEASLSTGLFSLWALAVSGWSALRGPEKCQDCNLPVDDGCRCECYSGGYDPNDPACQF